MLEKTIEKYLVDECKKLGVLCDKFTSPQRRSVPDRVVSASGGRVYFVELKAEGKKPTEAQLRDHQRRRGLGQTVIVIDSKAQVDKFVEFLK